MTEQERKKQDRELEEVRRIACPPESDTPPRLPRMRIAKKAAAELKKLDPETYLTEATLRRLMRDGRIPYVQVGSRMLVNLDWIIERLAAGETFAQPTPEERAAQLWGMGKIRPVKVR